MVSTIERVAESKSGIGRASHTRNKGEMRARLCKKVILYVVESLILTSVNTSKYNNYIILALVSQTFSVFTFLSNSDNDGK